MSRPVIDGSNIEYFEKQQIISQILLFIMLALVLGQATYIVNLLVGAVNRFLKSQ
jgi:hypothetical protein